MPKLICDWGMFNWALIPTVYLGVSRMDGGRGRNWWLYAVFLRGRLGFYRYRPA